MSSRLTEILPDLYLWQSGLSGAQQPVNSYLWSTPQGVVLIDPAVDLTAEILQPLGLSSVTDVFITHTQAEHLAGCENFPTARIHVPLGDEYLYEGAKAYHERETTWQPPWDWETRGNFRGHLAGARNERPPRKPVQYTGVLKEGDIIAGLRVLSTPGHGKHAVTLLAEIAGRRIAFCGDSIYGDGQLWNWFDCDWDYGLEIGQRALLDSTERLKSENLNLLCPAHGPIIDEPETALSKLHERLESVLGKQPTCEVAPLNFPETDSPARGWRELLPNLHQWRTGNCAALVSQTGNALLVDDGLCHWVALPERAAHHRAVIEDLKQTLGVKKIELVIPTHYHGDHIENIPELVKMEGAEVLSLDVVAHVMEQPEDFNLSAALPWYGTACDHVFADRKVHDGTRLNWHEYDLEIFHLGGQTFYHAGVAVTVDGLRVLFVGDAIFGWDARTEPVLCFNDNEPQARGWAYSLDRLIERKPDLLVCGHGSAIRDPMPLLEEKRAAWQQRLERFRELSARDDLRAFFDPYL